MKKDRRKPSGPKANGQIRAKQVRVIDSEGNQLGVLHISEAMRKAEEADLDLVEVAPDADPPVCRIVNLSKLMYQKERAAKAARKGQKREPHQLRLRPGIADHDLQIKIRAAEKFLAKGDQVYFQVQLRGRMQEKPQMGIDLLEKIMEGLGDKSQFVKPIQASGGQATMTLGPKR